MCPLWSNSKRNCFIWDFVICLFLVPKLFCLSTQYYQLADFFMLSLLPVFTDNTIVTCIDWLSNFEGKCIRLLNCWAFTPTAPLNGYHQETKPIRRNYPVCFWLWIFWENRSSWSISRLFFTSSWGMSTILLFSEFLDDFHRIMID